MIDWVNILLRTLMCLAFLVLVLRPMMMALVRREPDQDSLEELAKTAVQSAFKAWSQNDSVSAYYHDPKLALLVLKNPDMVNLPPPSATDASAVSDPVEPALIDGADAPASTQAVDGAASGEPGGRQVSSASTAPQPDGPAKGQSAASTDALVEEEVDPDEQLQQMRDRIKKEQQKAKPTIPAELLNNANSYEDKLMVVRMIVDQERDRVAATLKRMVQVE